MNTKETLFRYLHLALIDIRYDAHERGDKRIFSITNLLHNLPLQLAKDDLDYDELLAELVAHGEHNKGLSTWLENNKRRD